MAPTVSTSRRSRLAATAVGAVVLALVAAACIPLPGTQPIGSPPAPSGCITDVGPADKLVVTGCGGDITYNVSVPDRCMTHACGLILDVHGWTMSGDIQERNTRIAAIGRKEGFIVIQPSAPGASWNSGHYAPVASFVALARDVWRVDARRIHVTGFSQGGAMTNWMRCNRADLFASAAPTAMAGSACSSGVNMPTLYLQGLNDIFIPQSAVDGTIASYRTTHDLDVSIEIFDEDGVVNTAYASSTNPDTPIFETVVHDHSSYGVNGHCVLGAPDPADPYGCDEPTDRTHGRLIVDFFLRHPKAA